MSKTDFQETEFNWREETITQRSLLRKELEPLTFLVKDLITTPGLVVLAAKKKSGKSWMTLQLAQCVASGAPFLDKETKQGNVFYLALEDGERRLQYRLDKQDADNELPIRYSCWWPPINGAEGFEALTSILREKTPVLVVIDTLISARDKNVKENEADSIGELLNLLHDLAITVNTVILIVSHHGKKTYGDVGFDIRGSSAIPGATDTNMGLYKNTDGTFTLKAEGRDIMDVELRIKFDPESTWTWQHLGDDRDIRRVEAENRILGVIEVRGEAYAKDIAKDLGIAPATVYTHLKRMRTEGRVDYESVETKTRVKILYKLPKETSPISPTRLHDKANRDNRRLGEIVSRRVVDVGTESKDTDEDVITREEFRKLISEMEDTPDGSDVSGIILSYLPK